MKKKKCKLYPPTHRPLALHTNHIHTLLPNFINDSDYRLFIELCVRTKRGILEYNTKILAYELRYERIQSLTASIKKLVTVDLLAIQHSKSKNTSTIAVNPAYCLIGDTRKGHYLQGIGWEDISKKPLDTLGSFDNVPFQHEGEKYMTLGQKLYQEQCDNNKDMKNQMNHLVKLVERLVEATNNRDDSPELSKAKQALKKAIKNQNVYTIVR